jgi:basic amino acid/polyamine antiporter, APA family
MSDAAGRIFLVSGANTRIGRATAEELARRGGRVFVACRSAAKGEAAVGLAALDAYNSTFHNYTLVATLVIAVTYLFSEIAVVILPLRKPVLWYASPASKIKLFGVPVVPVAGVITIALLVFNLYEWLSNGTYGVNHKGSLIYMGAMYVLAIVVYGGARLIRNRQGIDLGLINKEIPVE